MRRHERQVFNYDFRVQRRARLAPYPSLDDVVAAWSALFAVGDTDHQRERGDIVYRIGDIDVDQVNRVVKILIRRGDIHASNPFFHDRATGNSRSVPRGATEDGERAAHLVISLNHEANQPTVYLGHLEGVPGISHRQVQAHLNALVKRAINNGLVAFSYADPGGARTRAGEPKMHNYVPSVEMEGHPAASVVNDLEQGHFHSMVLIDRRPRNQLGGNQYLVERERTLIVGASPNMPSQGRLGAILAAAQTQQGNFQTARLRFRDPAGNQRQMDYDIATGTPEQQNYVQSYHVRNINPPMDDSSLTLVPFLTQHMVAQVVADRT